MEIILTKQNFEEEVINAEVPVLVDFWATWCGPCKMLAPVITEIANKYQEKIKVGKVNIDEQVDLGIKYQILSIPTLILFKNGEIVNTSVGLVSNEEIEDMINK